ncbi:MAG: transketolase [Eubacteriales bacterium]|jgi:transketolase|nr:transketolase [Eubacteriales bacterium]MDD3110575.1 transketolase [Eubacteriales bacterium]MDD4133601.1 transketolase [Eubacteriales bacterium]NLO14219.1 transketolase [Clostridiales bacterium]
MTADIKQLEAFATRIRIGSLEAIKARGFGHVGGSLSIADTLAVLYGAVMRIDPQNPRWPERDKLVCSKGHAGPAIYATLGLKGFFPYEEIKTLNQPGTNFPSHCDRLKTPGVDMTTGSLGQGTSLAAGMALGDRLRGRDSRMFLIVGDGELNEGQPWESFMFMSAQKLDNITVLIDWNKKQLDGYVSDINDPHDFKKKFEAFGFHTQQVNGNSVGEVYHAVMAADEVRGMPRAIVLDTIKGAGVKEVEDTFSNHSMAAAAEVFDGWINSLTNKLSPLEGEVSHA